MYVCNVLWPGAYTVMYNMKAISETKYVRKERRNESCGIETLNTVEKFTTQSNHIAGAHSLLANDCILI